MLISAFGFQPQDNGLTQISVPGSASVLRTFQMTIGSFSASLRLAGGLSGSMQGDTTFRIDR